MAGNKLHYESRLQRLIDYIYAHLEEPLDLMTMAEVAGISQYHLHRIYRSIYGESVTNMVKRLRLHKAAGYLLNSDKSLDEITRLAGYRHLQSFTRAFSLEFNMPPASFRQQREQLRVDFETLLAPHSVARETMSMTDLHSTKAFPVTLKQLDHPIHLITYPHQGSYMNIGQAFEKLSGWAGMRQLFEPNTRMLAVYFHDPETTPEEELRSVAGLTVSAEKMPTLEAPLTTYDIPTGRYAVLRYQGPYANMHHAYQWFFGTWLTQSGYEVADQAPFEEYLNDPRQVAPNELLTDIYMPLKGE